MGRAARRLSRQFGLGAPPRGLERRIGLRDEIPRYLIVCEGQKTEPRYFEGFRVPVHVARIDVVGAGANTVSVVEAAIRYRTEAAYDQVWAVFDRDSFTPKRFNRALELARTEGIRVAYSNEAFELWYLLHFDFHDSAMSRKSYAARLTECLGRAYRKNDVAMFETLLSRQNIAIRNAKRLLAGYRPHNPETDNPSTTVHLLVEELLRHEVQHRTD